MDILKNMSFQKLFGAYTRLKQNRSLSTDTF